MRDWRLGRVITVVDRGFSSTVKEVKINESGNQRFIICFNPEQAARDKTLREQAIARIEFEFELELELELDQITAQRQRTA